MKNRIEYRMIYYRINEIRAQMDFSRDVLNKSTSVVETNNCNT